nr:transglutaminase-like domain-containing protein [Oscillospiraceae bacterium]
MEKGNVNSRGIIFAVLAAIAVIAIIMIIITSGIFKNDGDNASANGATVNDNSSYSVYSFPRESEYFSESVDSMVKKNEAVTDSEAYAAENNLSEPDGVVRLVIDLTEDPDNMNRIFADIIEQNAGKLKDVVEYGDKFCTNYVSVKNDLKVHEAVLDELRVLSNAICDGEENEYEKVRKIAYWVAENVYYNEVAASTSVNEEIISLETVLETKTATCAGYSNLFSSLCNMQDIYCINMRGGTSAAVT